MNKLIAIVLLAVAVAARPTLHDPTSLVDEELVLNEDLISSVNERQLGWTAAKNPRFTGMRMADAKRLLGLRIPEVGVSCTHMMKERMEKGLNADLDAPAAFDSRSQWPGYIHPIRDQASCGSCWAFAASETLSDRLAIASNGTQNLVLSAQALVSCDTQYDMGCGGGWPEYAADFLVSTGIPTDACEPYTSGGGSVAACPAKCADGSPIAKKYKYSSWDYYTGVDAMEAAVSSKGPIAVSMAVYQDFFSYSSGVYKWDGSSGLAGYHAIKLVGYTADYWIVANSWGLSWGQAGYFNIAKGNNECGIELGALDRACPLAGEPIL